MSARQKRNGASVAIEFGKRLRAARERRGFTQATVAEASGTYASQLSNYETGEVMPEGETLVALAEVLDVSLDELVLGRRSKAVRDVRDARLRAAVRSLEKVANRAVIDVAVTVTVISGLVAQARESNAATRGRKRPTR